MARNLLTSVRKKDSIYEKDQAKANRQRGNTVQYDHKAALRNNIILFFLAFVVGYLLFGALLGFLYGMINNTFAESSFMAEFLNVKKHVKISTCIFNMWLKFPNLWVSFIIGLILGVISLFANRKVDKKTSLTQDHTDINTYEGDRHILELDEMAQTYDVFPDAGAHSNISPTSIVGHVFFKNDKRLPKVKLAKRDEEGNILKDKNGKMILKTYDMFDDKVRSAAFGSVGVKDQKGQQEKTINPFDLKYKKIPIKRNSKGEVTKYKWQSIGEFIKENWYIPYYETERPTGAFFVEKGAVNTFTIAITRGNKGQLVVNNTIDNLSREADPQNMFINDPKGELFSGFHKLLEFRGIEPIVLNLMEPSKTHQFNVLGPAIMFARIGDYDQMRSSLNTVMNTFFPVEGDDPFWGNAQQTLVRMIIFTLIDYYIEEEREYLQRYAGKKDASTVSRDLDKMWSHVTMFNVYQMLTTMSRNEVEWNPKEFEYNPDEKQTDENSMEGDNQEDDKGEQLTQLTAFLKLLDLLPQNKMRTIAMQQSDAMDVMAASEKTRATVYGIALVAMLFFTDGPITAITCASPRQTLDPMSLAFPRRLRFKVNKSFLKEHALAGRKVLFEAYRDPQMKEKIIGGLTREEQDLINNGDIDLSNTKDKQVKKLKAKINDDFEHETKLDELGWVEYRFKGIFDEYEELKNYDGSISKIAKPIYIRMKIVNNRSKIPMYTFNFEFKRGHAKTVDGKRYVQNPRTNERIEQGGTLRFGYVKKESKEGYKDQVNEALRSNHPNKRINMILKGFANVSHLKEDMTHEEMKQQVFDIIDQSKLPKRNWFETSNKTKKLPNGMKVLPVEQTDAVYNVRPKAIFSITPPHLTDYIKIVIMMVAVLFDTSVGESYLTKESGKPMYKTRSILDELGNMQFDGHGIPAFQTKLSIGLGQGQEYLMVLQTLQQLRDVYGESIDKIVSSNTAVFIYLISNDMGMLEDLSKQAGNTHASRASSKNIRKEVGTFHDSVEDDVSYTYSTEQEPLFSVDKLLNFTTGESMVLSSVHRQDNSGEAVRPNPIFNTDKMIMPMAYALHSKGHTNKMFSTSVGNAEVATSSSGQDVYQTIPDFTAMYEKRVKQARLSKQMRAAYQKENNFSDQDMIRQDVNIVSESIMRMINATLHEEEAKEKLKKDMEENAIADFEEYDESFGDEDKSSNEGLDDTERRIVEKGGFDANQRYGDPKNAIITNEKDKKHQDNISQQESKYQQQTQLQQQFIYLDNQVSFSDLRNNDTIYNVLSEALYDAFNQVGSDSVINSNNPYQYDKLQNNHHVIKHTQTGHVLFDYWRIEENGQISEFWEVQSSFKKLVIDTAQKESINVSDQEQMQNIYMLNQNAVNQLFKVDESDIVYRELCSKIKDEFDNRGENANG